MLGLRHVLAAPSGRESRALRALTADRIALASVVAISAVATAPVVASIAHDMIELAGAGAAGMLAAGATTTALAVILARFALRARSILAARIWLAFGASLACMFAAVIAFAALRLMRFEPAIRGTWVDVVLFRSICVGGPIGFLLGTPYAPVIVAALRARTSPSHDAIDRVVFAGGATLPILGVLRALLPALPGAPVAVALAVAGSIAAVVSGARIVARVQIVRRVRDGAEPGLHVVPCSGSEDERALVPLVRAARSPSGVLTATGVSAPYRGARGVFKLALIPIRGELFDGLLAHLGRAALGSVGEVALALVFATAALLAIAPVVLMVAASLE